MFKSSIRAKALGGLLAAHLRKTLKLTIVPEPERVVVVLVLEKFRQKTLAEKDDECF